MSKGMHNNQIIFHKQHHHQIITWTITAVYTSITNLIGICIHIAKYCRHFNPKYITVSAASCHISVSPASQNIVESPDSKDITVSPTSKNIALQVNNRRRLTSLYQVSLHPILWCCCWYFENILVVSTITWWRNLMQYGACKHGGGKISELWNILELTISNPLTAFGSPRYLVCCFSFFSFYTLHALLLLLVSSSIYWICCFSFFSFYTSVFSVFFLLSQV